MKVTRGIPISALPPQCLKNNPQLLRKPAIRCDAGMAQESPTLPASAFKPCSRGGRADKALPHVPEAQIQDAFCRWLRLNRLAFVQARRDQRSTIRRGFPDFTVIHKQRVVLIETKTATGKLSPEQQAVFDELLTIHETPVHVCRSLDECIAAVTAHFGLIIRYKIRTVKRSVRV